MDLLRRPWVQVLLIVIALAGVFWFFWPPPLPRPDETNRHAHPAGYSLVIPPGFDISIDIKGNPSKFDGMAAQDNQHRSPKPRLLLERFREPPDVADLLQRQNYRPGTFQGREAYVFDGPRGRPPATMWHHRIVFEAGGDWFELAVMLPEYVDVPNDRWYQYLSSFRYDRGASTTPATAPGGS